MIAAVLAFLKAAIIVGAAVFAAATLEATLAE